jgi:phage I-like protein
MKLLLALLAASLPIAVNGAVQLLPAGEFAARDGRPVEVKHWKLTDDDGVALAARMNEVAAKTHIVIDYDHHTMTAQDNGHKAIAAGWIKRVEWRAALGLFADVEWTAAAKAHIDAGEYRYISPVLSYDAKTGRVVNVHLAALVNYPALIGMEPALAHLSTHLHSQEPHMDLKALIALLGLAADSTEDAVKAHLAALLKRPQALVPATLATVLGVAADADEAVVLAAVTKIKTAAPATDPTTVAAMQALQAQIVALQASNTERSVTELVDGAVAAKKLLPAMRDWALNLGKKDIAALQAFIKDAPALSLEGQPGGAAGATGGGDATSPMGLQVAAAMGITTDAWKKGQAKAA